MALRFSKNEELGPEDLDNPALRHLLGEYAAGGAKSFGQVDIQQLPRRHGDLVPIIDEGCAQDFAAALKILRDQLASPGEDVAVHFLVDDKFDGKGGSGVEARRVMLEEAVSILRGEAPAIAEDVLLHIGCVGFVRCSPSLGLVSASLREFPGLILLGDPENALAIVEALVHEGAHQKFFDIEITRGSFFNPAIEVDEFDVPWLPGQRWPLTQAIAAGHAYSYLAELARELKISSVPSESLLLVAAERAATIGEWLASHRQVLRPHARAFLGHLFRFDSDNGDDAGVDVGPGVGFSMPGAERQSVEGSERILIGVPSTPPVFGWVTER